MRVLFILLALVLTACGAQPSGYQNLESQQDPKDDVNEINNQCWIYPQYKLGDCKALVDLSQFNQNDFSFYKYPKSSDARYQAPFRLIDLKNFPVHAQLTKNFKASEFVSEAKGQYAILLAALVETVQQMRDQINGPLRINSGYRSPAYNKVIGGATFSRHMYGDGVDLAAPSISVHELKSKCVQAGASYVQVYADGHVHCDWRNYPLDATFYAPDPVHPPTLTRYETTKFLLNQYKISGSPEIQIQRHTRNSKDVLLLEAHLEHKEDPGELLVEWMISLPTGETHYYTGTTLEFYPSSKGTHSFRARVGGFVESSTRIEIQ